MWSEEKVIVFFVKFGSLRGRTYKGLMRTYKEFRGGGARVELVEN